MHIFQELKTLISHIHFKTIVIDNLHLFRKWRGSSPDIYITILSANFMPILPVRDHPVIYVIFQV